MSKLIDAQLVLLSSAAQCPDRMVPPKNLGPAAAKVLKPLLQNRFLEEVPTANGSIYRHDPEIGPIALRVTDKGLAVIGVEPEESADTEAAQEVASKKGSRKAGRPKPETKSTSATMPRASEPAPNASGSSGKQSKPASKPGLKQALLIEMLQTKRGANMDAIVEATGWLPHTGRAMISGLRKAGFKIEVARPEGEKTVYHIVAGPKKAAKARR